MDSRHEAPQEEPKKRNLQTYVYLIGLIGVIVLFSSLYRGRILNDQVSALDEELEEKANVRAYLRNLQCEFDRIYWNLWAVDYQVSASFNESLMSEIEANITITAHTWSMKAPAEQYWYTVVDAVLSETSEYDKYAWLFENGIITEWWVTDPNPDWIAEGTNIIIDTEQDEAFYYEYTWELLFEKFQAFPIYVEINFNGFDAYVRENITAVKNNFSTQIYQIQFASDLITIGILALSFLIDAGDATKKWKLVYLTIGLLTIGMSVYLI